MEELNKAINRLINEWCYDCNHSCGDNLPCVFEDYKEHCAIANLLYILMEKEK